MRTKGCHFSYFSKTFQTKKKLKRPKMTKIASRGPALNFLLTFSLSPRSSAVLFLCLFVSYLFRVSCSTDMCSLDLLQENLLKGRRESAKRSTCTCMLKEEMTVTKVLGGYFRLHWRASAEAIAPNMRTTLKIFLSLFVFLQLHRLVTCRPLSVKDTSCPRRGVISSTSLSAFRSAVRRYFVWDMFSCGLS